MFVVRETRMFPRLPQIHGDTDDDASVHLYRHVGPARPVRKALPVDDAIMKILNEEMEYEVNERDLNRGFKTFQGRTSSDYDSDTTVQELDEEPVKKVKMKIRPSKRSKVNEASNISPSEPPSPKSRILEFAKGFVVSFIVVLLMSYNYSSWVSRPNASSQDITTRFSRVEGRVDKLSDLVVEISQAQDQVSLKHDKLSASVNAKFSAVSLRFEQISGSLSSTKQFAELHSQYEDLKSRLERVELAALGDNPDLEERLNKLSDRLTSLSQMNENIQSVKKAVVDDLMKLLPQHVPVYMKDRKIHFTPEFQKFLYNFVDNYNKEKNVTWDAQTDSAFRMVSKSYVESFINKQFAEKNDAIWNKVNDLLDKVDFSANLASVTRSSNKVLLDSLLEVFAKGSVNVNYADYNLGLRILGFLTTSVKPTKSWLRKATLGWYDYLTSNGITSKNQRYNANNLLVDGGSHWHCKASECSFGVRLFSPVILTDIMLKNTKPSPVANVHHVSLYVKPKNPKDVAPLKEYLEKFKVNFRPKSPNKYLAKFYKIKELDVDPTQLVHHVKLPVSFINLQIPVKDIYVEISAHHPTGLYNFKAYGISEYLSYRYAEEFDALVGHMEHAAPNELEFDEAMILGDDESNDWSF